MLPKMRPLNPLATLALLALAVFALAALLIDPPPGLAYLAPALVAGAFAFVLVDMLRARTTPTAPALARDRYRALADVVSEAIIVCDRRGRILEANRAAGELLGRDPEALQGEQFTRYILPRTQSIGPVSAASLYRRLDREIVAIVRERAPRVWARVRFVTWEEEGGEQRCVAILRDVTQERLLAEHIADLGEHEPLTGLYNRTYLIDRLHGLGGAGARRLATLAVIDLDHFQAFNSACGRQAADRLLIETGELLGRFVRREDVLACLGGDVFAILFRDAGAEHLGAKLEAIRDALATLTTGADTRRFSVTASLGVVSLADGGLAGEALLDHAEAACRRAKRDGGNRVYRVSPDDRAQVAANAADLDWIHRLRQAMASEALALALEPIRAMGGDRLLAHEVLLRLSDSAQPVRPAAFLPSAERFGLMREIDRWVVDRALGDLARRRRRASTACYAINLSVASLEDPGFEEFLRERLSHHEVPAAALIFEVSEALAVGRLPAATRLLERVKALGCRTALDDFGAGMTSLIHLRNLPIDFVKIDGAFVRELAHAPHDRAIVRAAVEIARAFGLQVVAECVETEEARRLLEQLGVDAWQGNLATHREAVAARA